MTGATPDFPEHVRCACGQPDAAYSCFSARPIGVDETDGRYADVALLRCRACERLWLRYAVEYEGFSRSGRWARGLISEGEAAEMKPDSAAEYLAGLPWHIRGGSAIGGAARGRGRMHWGI